MTTMKNNKSYYGGGNDDRGLDGIDESLSSFGTGPMFATAKPTVKYAWTNNDKVHVQE